MGACVSLPANSLVHALGQQVMRLPEQTCFRHGCTLCVRRGDRHPPPEHKAPS